MALAVKPRFAPRLIIAALIGGAASVCSFLDSAGQALSDDAPALAVTFDAHNEVVNQRLAGQLIRQLDNDAALDRAAVLVQTTARTAPGLAPVLRNFALLVETKRLSGDPAALMQMAAEFSKRDLPTQLWLIEQAAASGDIDRTLAYYDGAMRTNPEVRGLLYPILARAIADPELIGPIAAMLRTNPTWAPGFYRSFADDPATLSTFPMLITALGADAATLIPKSSRMTVAKAMIAAGRLDQAETVALMGADAAKLSDFSNAKGRILPPFGWEIIRSGTVSASVAADNSLTVEVASGAGGIAAKRLVRLNGPTITVSGTMQATGAKADQMPRVHIQCAGTKQNPQFILPTPTNNSQFTLNKTVNIPNCQYAELSIRVPGNFVNQSIIARVIELGIE